jgi:hypothetical protein
MACLDALSALGNHIRISTFMFLVVLFFQPHRSSFKRYKYDTHTHTHTRARGEETNKKKKQQKHQTNIFLQR